MQSQGIQQISPPRPVGVSAAEIIGYTEDLLMQILIHLPIKSLGRFRCVSKNWNSLITHHLPPRTHPPCGLLLLVVSDELLEEEENGNYDLDPEGYEYLTLGTNRTTAPFSSIHLDDGMYIVHSTNGMLLFRNYNVYYGEYCVYSPITKQKTILPPLDNVLLNICLAYDPLVSAVDYKVIGLRKIEESYRHSLFEIVIYSSQTGLWSVSNTRLTTRLCRGYLRPVYLNGTVYWVDSYCHSGICFDIEGEQFKDFLPPVVGYGCIAESRGHLYWVVKKKLGQESDDARSGMGFDVYEEMGTEELWSLKYRIDVSPIVETRYDYQDLEFLFVVGEENEDDSYAVLDNCGIILSYNFKKKSFKEEFSDHCMSDHTYLYTEVLAFH
ncbi:hypothetical protein Tsubulata_032619 [Turnera subulata]|uniref:F-box domain-containing protein n=1 Tax=Turnera subulata TaxID=218843 RepID=A0A9Q0G4T3_9ROSI|nr:hypothetical protein Tsubulata_032619 [Turnera subulata]